MSLAKLSAAIVMLWNGSRLEGEEIPSLRSMVAIRVSAYEKKDV